jgi:hypothetical protein
VNTTSLTSGLTLASPNITTALTLTGASGTNGQYLTSAGSGSAPTWTTVASSQWTTSGSNIYYATGSVGIGTTSPFSTAGATTLSIGGTSSSTTGQIFLRDASGNNTMQFYVSGGGYNEFDSQTEVHFRTESGAMRFSTVNTERMRIDTSGNLMVNFTSYTGNQAGAPGKIGIKFGSGEYGLRIFNSTGGAANPIQFSNSTAGEVGTINTTNTNTSYNTSSDYRLKNTIVPMTGALAKVVALKPVTYKWKIDGSDGQGFIAHELQEVVPDCVGGTKDAVDADGNPVYQGVDTSFLVATLTAAIQEQQALLTQLTDRIAALEAK